MQPPTGEALSGSGTPEVPSSGSAASAAAPPSPIPLLPTSPGLSDAPPPALPDDIITEILIRLPQEDPSCLFRASLVCKPWLRIVSDPDFRRRLGLLHPTPPMLGFFRRQGGHFHFTATTASAFSLPIPVELEHAFALDCRHGRALFFCVEQGILVWEPMTGVRRVVPLPPVLEQCHLYTWPRAAVICAANGCDHSSCQGGPFHIVFTCSRCKSSRCKDEEYCGLTSEKFLVASVYSSEMGAWGEVTLFDTAGIYSDCSEKPSILVGRTVYFLLNLYYRYILKCNLDGSGMACSQLPEDMRGLQNDSILLMHSEDGGLGIAAVYEDSSLALWSWKEDGDDKKGTWACRGVMDLSNLVQEQGGFRGYVELLGFAEGINVIFIGVNYEIFTLELKSEQLRKLRMETDGARSLLPLISFYTPGIICDDGQGDGEVHAAQGSVIWQQGSKQGEGCQECRHQGAKPVVEGREGGQSSSFGASSTNGGVRSLPLDPIEAQLSNEESAARVRESVPIEATNKSSRVKKPNTKYLGGDWVNH